MEPSQYIFNNVGVLKSKVLSIVENKEKIAILDVSAKNHMPDILECPSYFPEIKNSTLGNTELGHNYILGGPTCLSGDVMGKYSFDKPLKVGDIITFKNQTAYTSIQSMYFNGVSKPDLIVLDEQENLKLHQSDSFEHYLTSVLRPPVSNIHHNQSPPPQAASYPVNKSYMTLLDVLN